jgi:hypothetical protein
MVIIMCSIFVIPDYEELHSFGLIRSDNACSDMCTCCGRMWKRQLSQWWYWDCIPLTLVFSVLLGLLMGRLNRARFLRHSERKQHIWTDPFRLETVRKIRITTLTLATNKLLFGKLCYTDVVYLMKYKKNILSNSYTLPLTVGLFISITHRPHTTGHMRRKSGDERRTSVLRYNNGPMLVGTLNYVTALIVQYTKR